MNGIDLIVAILAAVPVAGSVWLTVARKKRGESVCVGCDACKKRRGNDARG